MFTIRSVDRNVVEYVGPQYVPAREDAWSSTFDLLPGKYTVEIYDKNGDGLFSGGLGSRDGAWQLVAVYDDDDDNETELAQGGTGFFLTQIQEFVVANRPLESCISKKSFEEQFGPDNGVVCECTTPAARNEDGGEEEIELVCRHGVDDEICAVNHAPCGPSIMGCCGDRHCNNGLCRTSSKVSGKVSVAKTENGSTAGGVENRSSREGATATTNNNLRRQLLRGEKNAQTTQSNEYNMIR
jgi:hypothetical protein